MDKEKNIHKDHRVRAKDRFLREGLDGMAEHNVLELLLFYSIPRKDTNVIAHRLIDKFGSISGVFDAPYEALIEVDGVSEHTATLLKLMPELSRRYIISQNQGRVHISSIEDAGNYLAQRYIGVLNETVFLLMFDNKMDVIECVKVHEGSVNSALLSPRRLVEISLLKKASAVIISHNHPAGQALPSSDDCLTTQLVRSAFESISISFLGHIIVAGDTFSNVLDPNKKIYKVTKNDKG